jgi:enediyne biosynthesis protein E4
VTETGDRLRLVLCILCVIAQLGLQGRQRSASTQPTASVPAVIFADITQQAGLDFQHTNGASPDKHIVETMGSGGLFLDYDNDGWLDIFLIDGGSLVDAQTANRAGHRLYRNRRNGTFEDVT